MDYNRYSRIDRSNLVRQRTNWHLALPWHQSNNGAPTNANASFGLGTGYAGVNSSYSRPASLTGYDDLSRHTDRVITPNRKWPLTNFDEKRGPGFQTSYTNSNSSSSSNNNNISGNKQHESCNRLGRGGVGVMHAQSYHRLGDKRLSQPTGLAGRGMPPSRRVGVNGQPIDLSTIPTTSRYFNSTSSGQSSRSGLQDKHHANAGHQPAASVNGSAAFTSTSSTSTHRTVPPSPRTTTSVGTDAFYLSQMKEILYDPKHSTIRTSPTKIKDYLYLGSYWDANNILYLQRLGIDHVLNCAATRRNVDGNPYHPDTGVTRYMGICAPDLETYNMLQHVERTNAFISEARQRGGKILVHCVMGVNRSGFVVAAYLIGVLKMTLLSAVKLLKERRCTVLYNTGFQRQLVWYARKKGLL